MYNYFLMSCLELKQNYFLINEKKSKNMSVSRTYTSYKTTLSIALDYF